VNGDLPNPLPRGRLRRAAPLAGLAARTAGAAAAARLRGGGDADAVARHARAAERYAELLGGSKGALMKAGQMLSFVSLGPLIAPDVQSAYRAALARLRADAPPMAPDFAQAVLEAELGGAADTAFAAFDFEPLAAASLGQVHPARLRDGRRVAVKLQYPGVREAVAADLRNAELLAVLVDLVTSFAPRRMRRVDGRAVASGIGARIRDELDYRVEARHQAQFAARYRGHPFIRVPAVIGELCGERMLTQELVEGLPWEEAIAAGSELRDGWGEAIHRFAYGAANRGELFHADPHPGNYTFHEDGSVSVLDFGCVARLRPQTAQANRVIVSACLAGDAGATWRASVEAGLWSAVDPVTQEEIQAFWHAPFQLYWAPQPFALPADYMTAWMQRRYSPSGPSGNAVRHLAAPDEYVILGRMDVGVMSLLAGLRATCDWRAILAESVEGAAPRTPMGRREHEFFGTRPFAA
jgi:predicted unusual protein kinase regulating ubiquinone biosynthesis (AarF/ABC1/UbiB family)